MTGDIAGGSAGCAETRTPNGGPALEMMGAAIAELPSLDGFATEPVEGSAGMLVVCRRDAPVVCLLPPDVVTLPGAPTALSLTSSSSCSSSGSSSAAKTSSGSTASISSSGESDGESCITASPPRRSSASASSCMSSSLSGPCAPRRARVGGGALIGGWLGDFGRRDIDGGG